MGLLSKIFSKASGPSHRFDAIVALAASESAGFGHNYIGTEHVLCALIQIPDSRLSRTFTLFGLRLDNIRSSVLDVAKGGHHHSLDYARPQTPRLRRVLKLAGEYLDAAKGFTPPQSLLLSMLQDGNGVAIRTLSSLSVNLGRMRQELETSNRSLDPTLASGTSPAGQEPRRR